MVTALLIKILQLFVAMVFGFVLVKAKVLKTEDSNVLSKISLYLLMPAAIINAFNVKLTPEISGGIALAFVSALVIHIIFLILDFLFKRMGRASGVERASVTYPNAANLIIPIVSYVLGDEWVVYTCAFISVQLFLLWTHGIKLFAGNLNFKKILLNVNLITIFIGAVMMLCRFELPEFVDGITSSFGGMLGNIGMVIAGMMAAQVDYKRMLLKKRLYLVTALRMLIYPCITLGAVKCVALFTTLPNAEGVLLVSYLASITPSAATVMQLAKIHDTEPDYAVAINIVTTLLCVATMPLFVHLYFL